MRLKAKRAILTISFIIGLFIIINIFIVIKSMSNSSHPVSISNKIEDWKSFFNKSRFRSHQDNTLWSKVLSYIKEPISVKYILLISSLGRSGSTWVGELLCQQEESFYIFEPDYYYSIVLRKDISSFKGLKWIKTQMFCDFSPDYINYLWRIFSNILKSSTSLRRKLSKGYIKINCEKSKIRVIKTIRLRLKAAETLLQDKSLNNLKIIYLIRDPRASLISRQRLGWSSEPDNKCKILDQDLQAYNNLKYKYPQNIYILRYEDLSKDNLGEGSRLWQFLSDNKTENLPTSWEQFLLKHSHKSKEKLKEFTDDYDTIRDTKSEWLNWQREITETQLKAIEKYCNNSILSYGYNLFGSLDVARNLSYSSLKSNESCPIIPCTSIT